MSYFRECRLCGATLDPGERCDCIHEREEQEKKLSVMFQEGADGQMEIGGLYADN